MPGGFEVDLEALEQAASGVDGTLDEASQLSLSNIPHSSSELGSEDVADMLSDFLGRWKRGIDNLVKDGREVASRLTQCAKAYREADAKVQDHIRTINGELDGTGADLGAS